MGPGRHAGWGPRLGLFLSLDEGTGASEARPTEAQLVPLDPVNSLSEHPRAWCERRQEGRGQRLKGQLAWQSGINNEWPRMARGAPY